MELDKDRLDTFIRLFSGSGSELICSIREKTMADNVPVIRDEMAGFMRFMMRTLRPQSILEIGTAVGYSGIVMLESAPGAKLTTIENYDKRIPQAKANFEAAGYSERVELLEGDAGEWLKKLSGEYDVIFLDAAKGQYINWLPDILRLLKSGGVLITDNVLQDGDTLQSRYAVRHRDRTIHARMREFLKALYETPGLTSCVINVGDGAALSVKE